MKRDIFDTITRIIIKQLEAGNPVWSTPWATTLPTRWNGKQYRGINTIVLWATAMNAGYKSPIWLTFKAAKEAGGTVKKGERGTGIIYWGPSTYLDESGEEKSRLVMKSYTVFNLEQCDEAVLERASSNGLIAVPLDEAERIYAAEQFLETVPAKIIYDEVGGRAYYSPRRDEVVVPPFSMFRSSEQYYATVGHELVHWTGHQTRLNRQYGRYGDELYAKEELVAEIGAAFLCATLGIRNTVREDHVGYIASWLKALKNDNRLILHAAGQAQKAVEFLTGNTSSEGEQS